MPSEPDLTLRPAGPDDVDALTTLYVAARAAAVPAIPPSAHDADDVHRWLGDRLASRGTEVWLAEGEDGDAGPLGLLVLEDDWVQSLYVEPGHTGAGVGSLLLDLAKGLRPRGLGLYVFESNTRALAFYTRHGFGEVGRSDGSQNEEGAPDVELAWPDPASLAGLRRRVDAVDDRLAELLEERAGLTAAIQRLKPVSGHAGRDRAREDEIVARMAPAAPALGAERLRRIMQQVIAESLDAAEVGPPREQPAAPEGCPRQDNC
jgi:chorismate mutase/ribosomal protein S18 acetylase RimI-like enzyme